MKIRINKAKCTGCGLCEENLPEIFKIGKDSAEFIKGDLAEGEFEKFIEAVEDCPADAIEIIEE